MQAVTLVFEHVLVEGKQEPASDGGDSAAAGQRKPARLGSGLLAEHGAANAALKLLDELCMMVMGGVLLSSRALHGWSGSLLGCEL